MAEKRRRILESARTEILRNGLRGTTMEALAKAAGVAKPTLYKYFPDKDAIFSALVEELIAAKSAAFEEGFASSGPVRERIARGFAAMFATVSELLQDSPHAEELLNAHHRLGSRIRAADTEIADKITGALKEAGAREPEMLTQILFAAASGILNKFRSATDVRNAILLMCERMIELPGEARQV